MYTKADILLLTTIYHDSKSAPRQRSALVSDWQEWLRRAAYVAKGIAPDLLVADHLMPGITGVELARAVREKLQGLPVLIVSGYTEDEGIGPDLPRLTKPFRVADLAASLKGLTPGAG